MQHIQTTRQVNQFLYSYQPINSSLLVGGRKSEKRVQAMGSDQDSQSNKLRVESSFRKKCETSYRIQLQSKKFFNNTAPVIRIIDAEITFIPTIKKPIICTAVK